MRKLRLFTGAVLLMFALAFTGCGDSKDDTSIKNKDIFEEELKPLTDEEIKKMEENVSSDDEMTLVDEMDLDNSEGK